VGGASLRRSRPLARTMAIDWSKWSNAFLKAYRRDDQTVTSEDLGCGPVFTGNRLAGNP
jgi:hypothetical protein